MVVEPLPPSPPGALAEPDGGEDDDPPPGVGVVDGDGVWAAGAGGELGAVVVGAGAGAEAAGDGGEVGVAAGAGTGAALPEGGDDDGLVAGAGGEEGGLGSGVGGDVGGAAGGVRVPERSARTTTMSFSLARQLASFPLTKKKGPERSSVNTVLPSSNLVM